MSGASVVLSAALHGAPVTWSTPTETVDENSIDKTGTLFHAGTWGTGIASGPITVVSGGESIVFANRTIGTSLGLYPAVATGNEYSASDLFVSTGLPSSDFDLVMDGMAADGQNPKLLLVGGLTPGVQYQIQLFVSDDRACCGGRTVEWSDDPADGVGNESASFAMNTSNHVIGTFTADATFQAFYERGVGQSQNGLSAYVLRDLSPDTDGDGLPDHVEDAHDFLDKNVDTDAVLDGDGDGLSNLDEFRLGTLLDVDDTDGDGLKDGDEVTAGTNIFVADTDGDTLSDGDEVNVYNSNPLALDSDNDLFPDRWEARDGSELNNPASTPNGATLTIRGTGTTALLTSDLTDPENDGSDANATTGTGFNWVSATASSKPDFRTAEGALNIFDNKVGGGEAKWCCDRAPQSATVEFASYTALTHFTITSSNDSPDRDPRVWEIQGSADGASFSPIVRFDYTPAQIWTARNQVIRVDLGQQSLPYKFIRYAVYATNGANHALGEIEFFGVQDNTDEDMDGLPKLYEDYYAFLNDAPGNEADAAGDDDLDGLSNLDEFTLGTPPDNGDIDEDGLLDGAEIAAGTSPFSADTDRDTLSDGDELNVHMSNPLLVDSDGDLFSDPYEVANSSDPAAAGSTPGGVVAIPLGTDTGALLGGDITDRFNDGSDATLEGSGFDWVSISASSKANFAAAEGAYNVFDNKVGGGEAKWCCDAAPQNITVEFAYGVRLTHFTFTSSNDSPERDPRVWAIQGSNDGVNFVDIFFHDDPLQTFWGGNRNQVMRFDLPAPAPLYRFFRYAVTTTGSSLHAVGEIELFGIDQDTDGDQIPDFYEDQYASLDSNNADDALLDGDMDGLNNLEEYQNGTIPDDADSDDDGLDDGAEINTHLTNPRLADSDGDEIGDGYEVRNGGNPLDAGDLPDFAPITWAEPSNITGNLSDFVTDGLLVHAWNGGGGEITVGGIPFVAGASLGSSYGSFDPFDRGNDADYEALLNSGSYDPVLAHFLEIPGLIPGETYRLQIWVADTRSGTAQRTWQYSTYEVSQPYAELNSGDFADTANFPGQFVTGTFVATDDRQYLYVESPLGLGSQYNAITVFRTTGLPATLNVTAVAFNGAAFEVTVEGLDTNLMYQLRRSDTPDGTYSDVGTPVSPAASTHVFTDPSPTGARAFYTVEDVAGP